MPLSDSRRVDSPVRTASWRRSYTGLVDAGRSFSRHECTTRGAALAFFTVVSISPLVLVLVGAAGIVFGRTEAATAVSEQLQNWVGPEGADVIQRFMVADGE